MMRGQVVFTRDAAGALGRMLEGTAEEEVYVLADENSRRWCVGRLGLEGVPEARRLVMAAGEGAKSLGTAARVWQWLSERGARRGSVLVKVAPFRRWHYLLWCFGEVVVISFFTAMYTALFYGEALPYFMALPLCFKHASLILVYPYALLALAAEIGSRNAALQLRDSPQEASLVKFYDEYKRLKLSIDPSAILYINAEANYVKIHYLENERVREFLLRNSMKSLETLADRHGLVRCHRSYYVNPRHIKVLSRNKEGVIIAEMIEDSLMRIPVSKQYYAHLSELL